MGLDKLVRLALVLAGIALVGIALARLARVSRARDDARVAAGLVRDSLAAAADTTRVLHFRVETLGESLTVVQRRSVQTAQRADALDTLGLEVRISCGAAGESGVRPAMASVVAPAWVTLRMQRVEQAPGVCLDAHPHRASNLFASARRWVSERAGVTLGIGMTRDGRGVLVAGPGVMLGVRAWP